MKRREEIKATLKRIKLTRSLAAKLIDFIELARGTGYDPVLSARILERFQSELRDLRARLIRLTLNGQKDYARRGAIPHSKRKAAA